VDGEQYVTVLSGFGSVFFVWTGILAPERGVPINGRVYTFKLGATAEAPPVPTDTARVPTPPVLDVSRGVVQSGGELYSRFCVSCHGLGAISGGALPDLRKSSALQSAEAWRNLVLGGERTALGMAPFEGELSPLDVDAIRAYVIGQARIAYAVQQRR
jgi:quinohemoprotein ethanol dehydrogenase